MDTYIKAISYYLPEKTVSNDDLIKEFPEWSVEKVAAKIGVNSRHLAAPNETAGDMAEKAARKLFEEYDIKPDEIDFILLCTQSPDYFLPTTACIIQHKLKIPTGAGALDFNLGCSGYVYGLAIAKGLIASNTAKNILLLTAETYSKYLHPLDKSNRSIFGDGASATLVSTTGFASVGNFVLGTDGKGVENLIVRTGASREQVKRNDIRNDENGTIQSSDFLYMNGSEIFNFTLDTIPALIQETLQSNELEKKDINLFVFHQANKFMLDTLRKVCAIPKNIFYINLGNTGNTVSSTIPIALKQALQSHIITDKMNILIAGFGVGYSWGGCVLRISERK
jgi:3-oxoacyl-[acyl-carrier-protein] synthase-3